MLEDIPYKSPSQQAFEKTWIYKIGQDDSDTDEAGQSLNPYKAVWGKYWKMYQQALAYKQQQKLMQQQNAAQGNCSPGLLSSLFSYKPPAQGML